MRKLAPLVLLLAAAGWAPCASAFTDEHGVFSSYTGGRTTIPTPVTNSNWTAGVSGSSIKVGTTATIAARNGKTVSAPVFKLASESAAKAGLAKMARALPVIGTGLVVLDMLREFGIFQGMTGALDYDGGLPAHNQQVPCWKIGGAGPCYGSAVAAGQAKANADFSTYMTKVVSAGSYCTDSLCFLNIDYQQNVNTTAVHTADWNYAQNSPTTQLVCDYTSPWTPPRRDGRCPGGTVTHGITDAQAADHMDADGGPSPMTLAELATKIGQSMGAAVDDNYQYPLDEPMSVGPVPDVTISTSTSTDNATPPHTVTTTEKDVGTDDGQGDVDWTTQTTTDDGTTETTTDEKKTQLDPCGLPTTPPCKIDEGDTPKTEALKTETDAYKDASTARQGELPNVTSPTGKNTAWSWSLSFPTTCVPLTVDMRVGSIGQIVTLNPCSFIAVFHELMSMIWAASTLFLVVGMVGRTLREV